MQAPVMQGCMATLGPCAAALGVGAALRRTGVFSSGDGETAAKFVNWVTLPSLILQTFNGLALADIHLPVLLGALLSITLSSTLAWLAYRTRHPKERGLLAGAAGAGGALPAAAVPLAAAAFGPSGLQSALLVGAAHHLASWAGSYLLFSTAGAAFPEQYKHEDGGTYRGEWVGMLKQGFGTYTYPSGARYEGEWRNGAKEGRGVYRFPKGGLYEGEWRGGRMEGVGVRTFASGRVQAGVWREGRLEVEWDEAQCSLAVEGAGEAAAAAARVAVGGGTPGDALRQLLADPPTWAYAAAAALVLAGRQLTPTLDLATSQLALAHGPLALLAWGLTLEVGPPQPRQAADVGGVLTLRLLPPLALGAAACGAALRLGWPVAATLGALGPALVCAVAPTAPQVLGYAHRFRLNKNLAAAIARTSTAAALALAPLLAVAATLSAAAGSVLPFLVALGGTATAVGALVAVSQLKLGQPALPRDKVRMTYAPAAAAAAPAPAAAVAGIPGAAAAAEAPPAAGSNGGGSAAPAAAAANPSTAPPAEPQPPPPRQRRRSAFIDLPPEQPPPAKALSQRSTSAGLRLRQPAHRRQMTPRLRPRPAAAAAPASAVLRL